MTIRLLLIATLGFSLGACDLIDIPGNGGQFDPADQCGGLAMPISRIQGYSHSSPLLGRDVVIDAVVIGNFAENLGGIFVQDQQQDRDGDLSTSEGMFVALDRAPPQLAVGDVIRAAGLVAEIGQQGETLTSLTALTSFRVCGAAEELPLPAIVEQALLGDESWERYEGMRVSIETPLTVIDQGNLYRRGQLTASLSGRQFSPTEVVLPGEQARLHQAVNTAARIVIDDANLAERPEQLPYLKRWPRVERPLRIGSRISSATGVLDHRQGEYRLYPEAELSIEQAPRTTRPPDVDGDLRVAAFNVLNYFNGDGQGGGFPTDRGAVDSAALKRQQDKLLASLVALNADLYALMELENDGYGETSAIVQLAAALDRKSSRRRDYVALTLESERLGGDDITVGMLYDRKRLSPEGAAAVLDSGAFTIGRPVLLQAFRQLSNDAVFNAGVMHFKSKGGCKDADTLNRDQNDGQGCHNATRVKLAKQLADWLENDLELADPDVLLLGDFNAHALEDPIRLLAQRGFVRIADDDDPSDYTYNYRGQSGSLDHALANQSLREQIEGSAPWHINADELVEADYRLDGRSREARRMYRADPYRSSDHDPLIIGLDLRAEESPE